MVSYFFTNTASSVGWYVDGRENRHVTCNRKIFDKFNEQDVGMQVELDDDVIYLEYAPSPFGCL
jgi:hypothetical protein